MKLRDKASIKREYERASRAFRRLLLKGSVTREELRAMDEMRGTVQALAWVLEDHAMEPVKAIIAFLPKAAARAASRDLAKREEP